jgi:hypothetical protein
MCSEVNSVTFTLGPLPLIRENFEVYPGIFGILTDLAKFTPFIHVYAA